jgi:hypothetical protein
MTGLATPLSHSAYLTSRGDPGSSTYAQFTIQNAKPSTQYLLVLGMDDPNLAFGACANLRCSTDVLLSAGSTDATGYGKVGMYFAHQPSYIGAQLRSQIVVSDAGKSPFPVALSNARVTTYPQSPVFTKNVASCWLWTTGSVWVSSYQLFKDSAVVVGI